MYIRAVKTTHKITKKVYTKLLVQSYMKEKGPRQRTFINLGSVDTPRELLKEPVFS